MKKVESIFIFLIVAGVSLVSIEMAYAQTPTIYMQDTTASFGLSTHSGRQIHAEYVTGSSVLVGKQIDTIIIKLKKVGLPTGNVEIGIFNKDLSEKKIFATRDVSTITKKYTDYTFSLSSPGQPYQIQKGDRIGIKYSGGDATNYVAIMTDQNTSDPFDGTNSFHTYSTASGWNIYNTHDLYMTLELVTPPTNNCQNSTIAAVTAIGSDGNIPANAIDGNLTTRWSNLGVGSWITLDLGAQKTVCNLDIAWYLGNQRSNNFVISTSTDGNTFTSVYTGTSNGTTASFENYDFSDVTARYVKITVNGNTINNWASISEINVKALTGTTLPADTTPPITTIVKVTDGNNNVVTTGGTTNSNSISITFSVDGTGSPVVGSTCQLDSNPAAACTSPVSYTGLSSVTHAVGISSTDLAGNVEHTAEFTWAVNPPLVVDPTPPVITLVGSNPVTVQQGSTYTDAGATATDNIDGNITPSIVTVNPVNTGVAGTYFVTYNVKDAAGNSATQVARIVNVVAPPPITDTTPPVITLVGSNPITVQFGSTYTDAGATATDNIDGAITSRIVTVNPVNTGVAGTYFVTYNVKDAAGNAAIQVARIVTIVAPTPTGTIRLDSFGVQQFYAQDPSKQSYVLSGNPNSQPGSRVDGGGSATAGVEGALHYWSFPGRVGGLASGGTQTTARLNLNPQLSTGTTLDWQVAEQKGYQASPQDIAQSEMTGYLRLRGVVDNTQHISYKVGGEHTSSDGNLAGTFGMDINFNGVYGGGSSRGATSEKELTYPNYEFFSDPVHTQTGVIASSTVEKWVGIKVVSRHVPNAFSGLCTLVANCQGQLYQTYIDIDPIDLATGKPKNNWHLLASHLDDGSETGMYSGHKTVWGMKFFQWRVNGASNIDFAYLSVHGIDPTTGQNIPN